MDSKFFEWLDACNYEFISVYNRYGYSVGHGYIVWGGQEILNTNISGKIEDLGAGDCDASQAMGWLLGTKMAGFYYGIDENPTIAMKKCIEKIYNYYVG